MAPPRSNKRSSYLYISRIIEDLLQQNNETSFSSGLYCTLMNFAYMTWFGNKSPSFLCSAKPSIFIYKQKRCFQTASTQREKTHQINVCLRLLYQFPDFLSLHTYLVAFIKELCATNFYDVLSSGSDRPRPLHSKQTQHGHYMCVSSPVMSPERYEQRVRPGKHIGRQSVVVAADACWWYYI